MTRRVKPPTRGEHRTPGRSGGGGHDTREGVLMERNGNGDSVRIVCVRSHGLEVWRVYADGSDARATWLAAG